MNGSEVRDRPTTGGAENPEHPADSPVAVMFSLIGAANALEDRLEEAFSAIGSSSAKLGVLANLAEADAPLTLSELAARIDCVRSNITQLVDRLEGDGLVRRVDDPTDRRVTRAALTPLGEERHAAGAQQMEKVQPDFAASLPERDRVALRRLLPRIS